MSRYVAVKPFVGVDGRYREGDEVRVKAQTPVDTWLKRGLIKEQKPDIARTPRPESRRKRPQETQVYKPEVSMAGPDETKQE